MRHNVAQCGLGILCLLALALTPAFAEVPEDGVIDPGHGIGPAALGMGADKLLGALGKADFQKENEDGTTLYEWGLLTQGDLPDAVLWVLIDGGSVAKVGTDGGKYQTPSGLGVGSSAEEFVRAFGFPAKNPAPGFYVFRQGIGIAVGTNGNVHTIWIEQIPSQ